MDSGEISKISDQFKAGQWPRFLEMVEVSGLRGWAGQTVNFTFPVVAVVGENGTGKSTLLQAAACAYENADKSKTFYPSTFFLNTRWDTIQGVSLKYRIKTGSENQTFQINKPTKRWSFPEKRVARDVFILDISRTLPLGASVGYAKIARLAASEVSTTQVSAEYTERLSHVLGRNYKSARFATSDVDSRRQVGLLTRESAK
jgi:predicted ATP-dependent endonuclease of OLD family